jgi:hypothetical protein
VSAPSTSGPCSPRRVRLRRWRVGPPIDPRPSWASCSSGCSPLRIVGMPSHSLRPRRWPRRTPRDSPPAFRRCAGWLAWIQAAVPLELCGLNPQPPFESRVRGLRFRRPTKSPDTGGSRASRVPRLRRCKRAEFRHFDSERRARTGRSGVGRLGICGGSLWSACEQGIGACRRGAVD